jgi:cell division protein FtsI (penicillin-binding protein 3)
MIDVLEATERPGDAFETSWRRSVKQRIVFVLAFVLAWGGAVEARLLWLQVVEHDYYVNKAIRQQHSTVELAPLRGDIVDRHGNMLAQSADASSIFADPSQVDDPTTTAGALCTAFHGCTAKEKADLITKLAGDGKGEFTWIRRWRAVTPEEVAAVEELNLPGIGTQAEPGRYYPNMELAAHVLGFVGIDNSGLGGIEAAYDSQIRGQGGKILVQLDGGKPRHRMETVVEQEQAPGATVELTIDRDLQYIAERELAIGVKENKAKGGTAIIMRPQTGEILALASYPTFNPNSYAVFSPDERRNRAVQDVYEPGSTFKIVTASAALQENVFKLTDLIDCNPGVITFPGRKPITEAKGHNYGVLPLEDVIVKSSNIGAIKIGLRVGADRLSEYVHRFGFGQALGSDFKGESKGVVWPAATMTDSTLASMSMGYNVSVTPLQMVTAASVVANGGTLYEPYVVAAIDRDGHRQVFEPKPVRQAITPETAATLTTIMEGVVLRGTATLAQLDGYQVAGKTGTANKLENGHYAENEYNASFVGFVPSRQPEFTILVLIDTPRGDHHYGGDTAAPVFNRIASAILERAAVPRTLHPTAPLLITTDAVTPAQAPPVVVNASDVNGRPVMPDVRGLAARDALRTLGAAGLSVHLNGAGFVASQTPEPGQPIEKGDVSVLNLRRAPEPSASSRAPKGSGR